MYFSFCTGICPNYGKSRKKTNGGKSTKKKRENKYEKLLLEKLREKNYEKKIRGKKYGKIRENKVRKKSKGTSHVTSGDVTSGQACAMVRSSLILRKYYFFHAHILLLWVPTVSQFASLFFYSYGADFIQGIFKKIKKS